MLLRLTDMKLMIQTRKIMNRILIDNLENVKSVGIAGHVHPDGDCIGSTLSIYNYIKLNYKDIRVDAYLEEYADKYYFIEGTDSVKHDNDEDFVYDLFIAVDSSSLDRLGHAIKYFESAKKTLCIDHHISNENYADELVLDANASSTCEIIFDLFDIEKINKKIAEALYVGMVTDSGVFKYGQTSRKTMEKAGRLLDFGLDTAEIIDGVFYQKTYRQNQIMGRILLESMLIMDGRCILGYCTKRLMDFYNVTKEDMDGVVEQLRLTKGVECAIFLYETGEMEFKASLRSKKIVDVSTIAVHFGGGGHMRAAGFTMHGTLHDIVNNITEQIELQL